MHALINYAGLRNRPAVVVRANAALPLADRVAALQTTLRALLSLVAEQRTQVLASIADADSTVEAWGADPGASMGVPLRAEPPRPRGMTPIAVAVNGHQHNVLMTIEEFPSPAAVRRPPMGYVLQPDDSATARLLGRHGIVVQHHTGPQRVMIVERFVIDSLTAAPAGVAGHWLRVIADTTLPAGSYIIPAGQSLDLLTMQLLEPESDGGLAAMHYHDRALHKGGYYPVVRLLD
jgi:hypothetical protein